MAAVVAERAIDLASPADDVWPLLTDTDRLNRLLGTGPITLRPIEPGAATSARFLVGARAGGFALEYEELPFEWIHGRSFGVHRRMRGGPLVSYGMTWRLEPHEGGTRVLARLEIVPRYAVMRPIASFQARRFVARAAEPFFFIQLSDPQFGMFTDNTNFTQETVNFEFAAQYQQAIEAKQVAEQHALTATNDLRRIEVEAKQAEAQAQGRANAMLIEAKAESERQTLLRSSMTKELVQWEAIRKWNGQLPTVSGETGTLIDLGLGK